MTTETRGLPEQNETDAHRMMSRMRFFIKWLLFAAGLATVGLFIFLREAAYLAAIPIPILVLIYSVISQLEKQSRTKTAQQTDTAHRPPEIIKLDVQAAGIYTGLGVFFMLALGTFIVAASFFDWSIVGIGATACLLLALLIEIPYLPLFISEARRDERHKTED